MKNLFLFLRLVFILQFLVLSSMSQTTPISNIKLDTINVSGRITAGDGSQIANITLITTSQDIHYLDVKANTKTDLLGNFVLKGIKPIDTISFFALGSDYTFINNGSRYLNIIIWPKVNKINSPEHPAVVTARGNRTSAQNFELNVDTISKGTVYMKAQYPGGVEKFIRYISRNTKYPDNSCSDGIEGTVTVEFIISKTGKVTSPKIINGLDKYCNQAVIDAFNRGTPKWVPSIVRGRPVETTYQLDIVFKFSGPIKPQFHP
jgi:TonB family protein